jgi:hypothetical protein
MFVESLLRSSPPSVPYAPVDCANAGAAAMNAAVAAAAKSSDFMRFYSKR